MGSEQSIHTSDRVMASHEVVQELEEEGFGVKVAEDGIVAYLDSRKPSRHELVDAVPELEKYPMGRVEDGVFVLVGE
jgi:hypothetical protein